MKNRKEMGWDDEELVNKITINFFQAYNVTN